MLLFPFILTALIVGDCGSSSVHTFPAGFADLKQRVAYVQSEDGYVDALQLSTGKRIWQSSDKAKPLGLYGNDLIAAAPGNVQNELSIIVLKETDGSLDKSPTVSFPSPVNTASSGFAYSVTQNNNLLQLAWSYEYPNRGGARRRPDSGVPLPHPLSGLKVIDINRDEVEDANPGIQMSAPEMKQVDPTFLSRDDSSAFTPWLAGNSDVELLIRDLPPQKQLLLKIVHPKGGPEERVLLSGPEPSAYKSGDGCYLFVIKNPPDQPQPWYVFSALTGTLVGTLAFRPGYEQPDVIGSTAFWQYVERNPPDKETSGLQAVDLATGRSLWTYILGTRIYTQGSKRLE